MFHVKAFGMMTRHPVRAEQLPADLRAEAQVDDRGRVDHPSRELRGEVFTRFRAALEPLREAGKLGGILMQFPSYITRKPASLEYLEWAKERLGGDEMMVEFRHRSWLEPEHAEDTLAFLRSLGATYVMVDAPRTDARNLVPTVVAATSDTAYLRLHGRNAATWNVRGRSAAERFDYLYSREELAEWSTPLRELSSLSERTYAMFNNNGRSAGPEGADRAGADERATCCASSCAPTAWPSRIHHDQPQREHAEDDAEPSSGRGSCASPCWRTGPRSSARSISRSRW